VFGKGEERPGGTLSTQAAAVRARCERSAVEPCRVAFDDDSEFGLAMPVLLVAVRWRLVSGWVCKPEVTGSIPVRSIADLQGFCWDSELGQIYVSRRYPAAADVRRCKQAHFGR